MFGSDKKYTHEALGLYSQKNVLNVKNYSMIFLLKLILMCRKCANKKRFNSLGSIQNMFFISNIWAIKYLNISTLF